MSSKVKVLQLQYQYDAGVSDLAEQVICGLPGEQFDVTTAFLCGSPPPEVSALGVHRSIYFGFQKSSLAGLRLKVLWTLYKFCRRESFDVVIAHRFKPINVMMILSRWLKVSLCIGVLHRIGDFDRPYRRKQVKRLKKDGWYFVGVSEAVRQHLLAYRCGFDEHNTFAITNAIDIEKAVTLQLPREEARKKLGLASDALIIGALGRLVPVKGHCYLIEAFAKIEKGYPGAQLAIIGEGRRRQALQAQIEELGLSNQVHLLGFHTTALQYLRAFDVFVMPSLEEGLGLALLEGMCARLPIIASDVPAMRPLIAGAGGIAVPPADVDELAQALDRYMSLTFSDRQALGQDAFEYLCREHSIESFREAYKSLIWQGLRR